METNLMIPSTHSSSVISLTYEFSSLIPDRKHKYPSPENGIERMDNLITQHPNYRTQDYETEKLQTVIDFSQKIIENSKDIDSEFVDIVNDNFWELI